MTMECNQPLLARFADDPASLGHADMAEIEAHLETCPACRAALDEQRYVSAVLRDRLAAAPAPGFVARVSARIDRDASDSWLDIANWRAWTVGLAPVAAALLIAAYLGLGAARTSSITEPVSFDEVTVAADAAILQPAASGDALIEAVLTGAVPSSGAGDGR